MKKYKLIKEYPGSPSLGTIKNSYEYMPKMEEMSNYPEFWEEIVEKDYEILSLKNKANSIINKENVKKYFTVQTLYEDQFKLNSKYSPDEFKIHSVKRLSDGEIFTIGDGLSLDNAWKSKNCKIKSFKINQNSLDIEIIQGELTGWYGKRYNQCFSRFSKVKQSLFTTEDGVDIFEGDNFWYVNNIHNEIYNLIKSKAIKGNYDSQKIENCKDFSTKEKAEEYILMNKPCLSLNEVFNTVTWLDNSKKLLKELVKQKLKQ